MAAESDFDWLKPGDRQEFVRVRRSDEGGSTSITRRIRRVLSSCAWADGLVDIPVGGTVRRATRSATTRLWRRLRAARMRKPEHKKERDITK